MFTPLCETQLHFSKKVTVVLDTRLARHAETTAVTNKLHRVLVHSDQANGVNIRENTAVESTGSDLTEGNSTQI